MGTATTVSPWYKLFKKGEKGVLEFRNSLVRRKEVLLGLGKFLFSSDTAMHQIVDVVSIIEVQKNALSDNMRQLKILLEEERKLWGYLAQAILKQNHTILTSKTQLEHAETLRLDKNKVLNLKAQYNGAIASVKEAYADDGRILKNILNAEAMFLPFENNNFLSKQKLQAYFERVKTLKAITAMEMAERAA